MPDPRSAIRELTDCADDFCTLTPSIVQGATFSDQPMPLVRFTPTLQRHVACTDMQVEAPTVRDALQAVFVTTPALRSYLVDEQGALRKHVTVFVDGTPIRDRVRLSDALRPDSDVDVLQALSGG